MFFGVVFTDGQRYAKDGQFLHLIAIFSFAWDMKRGCVASQILILDVKNHGTKMPSISAKQDDEMRTWLG